MQPPRKVHIASLTGLRFYAAFLVFIAHMYHFDYFGVTGPARSFMMSVGAAGVSIFFVLSGFVLKINYPALRAGVDTFYVSRFARIYPAFFVTLLLAVPMEVLSPDKTSLVGPFVANLFMMHCFEPASCGAYNDVGWTLAVEAFFYLTFPLLIVLTKDRLGWGLFWTGCLLGLILLNLALRPDGFYASHQFPPNRLFEFSAGLVGGMLYLRWRGRPGDLPARLSRTRVRACVGGALLVFIVLLFLIPRFSQAGGTFLLSGLLSLVLIVGLAALESEGARSPLLMSPAVLLLGEISYSFYLVHNLILRYFSNGLALGFGVDPAAWSLAAQVGSALGLLALALVASYLLYRLVEQPGRRWIKARYRRQKQRVGKDLPV